MLRGKLFAMVVLFVTSTAVAGETLLSAGEISRLLTGNTISGDWGGAYKQYFDTNGVTVYVPSGRSGDQGKWRVNTENNSYESWWEMTGWTAYKIAKDGNSYLWFDSKANKYPFVVLEGKQVTW